MQLPVGLIYHKIKAYLEEGSQTPVNVEELCERPVFYQKGKKYQGEICLVDGAEKKEIALSGICPLVILEKSVETRKKIPSKNILILKEGIGLSFISNYLHEVFRYYEDWENRLRECAWKYDDLNRLLIISAEVLKNHINIMNSDFTIIAASQKYQEIYESLDIPPFDKNGRLHAETVNNFKTNPFYNEVKSFRHPFLYSEDVLSQRVMCVNVFLQDEYAARVVMIEKETVFQSWDLFLLGILGGYVQEVYNRLYIKKDDVDALNHILFKMINGMEYSHMQLVEALETRKWKTNDAYCVVYIQPSIEDFHNNTLNYFVVEMMEHYPECCPVKLENRIAILVNLKNHEENIDEFIGRFVYFLREGNFRAGYSNVFFNIEYMALHFRQAKVALQLGLGLNSSVWQHKFREYTLEYILRKATEEFPARFLCMPEMMLLKEYDDEKGSDYLKTLKVFFQTGLNATQAAKNLHIQRGTFLYRLERIKEIANIDLKDEQQFLMVQLSLKMIDNMTKTQDIERHF